MGLLVWVFGSVLGLIFGISTFTFALLNVGDWTRCIVVGPPDSIVSASAFCDFLPHLILLVISMPAVLLFAKRFKTRAYNSAPEDALADSETTIWLRLVHAMTVGMAASAILTYAYLFGRTLTDAVNNGEIG